jgi:hypothetical protein
MAAASALTEDQLEELQAFLKDWLRHAGRTQSDLRRALRAPSIRMPVLLEELRRIHEQGGLTGLADRLCGIEAGWQAEEHHGEEELPGSLGQLDLLLEEIRQEGSREP